MIFILKIIYQNYKVNQYQDHDKACYSSLNYNGIRLKISNFKSQYLNVEIIYSFITHRNMGFVLSVHDTGEVIFLYTIFPGFFSNMFYCICIHMLINFRFILKYNVKLWIKFNQHWNLRIVAYDQIGRA